MSRPIRSPLGRSERHVLYLPAALVVALREEATARSEEGAKVTVSALVEECVRLAMPDVYARAGEAVRLQADADD